MNRSIIKITEQHYKRDLVMPWVAIDEIYGETLSDLWDQVRWQHPERCKLVDADEEPITLREAAVKLQRWGKVDVFVFDPVEDSLDICFEIKSIRLGKWASRSELKSHSSRP